MKKITKREIIYNKSRGKYFYCGIDLPKKWHIDHFVALNRLRIDPKYNRLNKRLNELDNLVPSCISCNSYKAGMTIWQCRYCISTIMPSINNNNNSYRVAKRFGLVKEIEKEIKFWYEINNIDMEEVLKLCEHTLGNIVDQYIDKEE